MINTTVMKPKVYTDQEIYDSPYWDDYVDIGIFLFDTAVSVEKNGGEVDIPEDDVCFVLGAYFTDTVFDGNLEKAYEYTVNLKPYDYGNDI